MPLNQRLPSSTSTCSPAQFRKPKMRASKGSKISCEEFARNPGCVDKLNLIRTRNGETKLKLLCARLRMMLCRQRIFTQPVLTGINPMRLSNVGYETLGSVIPHCLRHFFPRVFQECGNGVSLIYPTVGNFTQRMVVCSQNIVSI